MHVLFAEFTAQVGSEELVRRLIVEYADVVRREPGNASFEVFEKSGLAGQFFVFERYVDDEAFAIHLDSAAGTTFNAALAPHILGGASQLTTLHQVS
jgi:quinol monooxygenase YgiN